MTQTDHTAIIKTLDLGGDGPTVVVKDCIDVAGEVTACGSAALREAAPAPRHADVVENLLSAGCHVIGKANMHELAYGMTGLNESFGTPVNPRWPDRIPGGSSSGSAVAVAAGLCDFAIGTDTGGSVRQPAICCGVFGIKPTFGRISRKGCHPAESSLDCVGVIARTAGNLTLGMQALDPSFARTPMTRAPRVARIKCALDKAVGDPLIYAVMEGLGAASYIELPLMQAAFEAGMTVIGHEAAKAYAPYMETPEKLGADVRTRLENARTITPDQLADAERVRRDFTAQVDAALERFDVLMTPALPVVPPTLAEAQDPATVLPLTRFLRPFNLSGHPAIVLPIPVGPQNLPAGIQIIGRKNEDAELCEVAEWLTSTLTAFKKEETA
ncbi:amidase [Thalassococcus sp. BH17M4-6]|uniref:amidase n=1 Tax=Thalassococcus sp. BH17M4-6 TaxID=3413148 RepID=UPI003BC90E02